jgi:hypothetical protein
MSATNEYGQADHFVKEIKGREKTNRTKGNVLSGK